MKLIATLGALAIIYAELYAIWDILTRQGDLSFGSRALWLLGIFVLPVIGTISYLRMGPGAAHWPPWDRDDDAE